MCVSSLRTCINLAEELSEQAFLILLLTARTDEVSSIAKLSRGKLPEADNKLIQRDVTIPARIYALEASPCLAHTLVIVQQRTQRLQGRTLQALHRLVLHKCADDRRRERVAGRPKPLRKQAFSIKF